MESVEFKVFILFMFLSEEYVIEIKHLFKWPGQDRQQ